MKILGIETSCDETGAAIVEDGTKILSNVVASSQELHIKTGGIIPEIAAREQIRCIIPVIEEVLLRSSVFRSQFSVTGQSVSRLTGQPTTDKQKTDNRQPRTDNCIPDIDALAVTVGPGLIGSLLVGIETAKTLAYIWQKPIIPVNHLLAHVYANWLTGKSMKRFNGKTVISKMVKDNTVLTEYRSTDLPLYGSTETPKFPLIALIVSGGHTELILMTDHCKYTWLGGTRDDAAGEAFDKIARLLGLGYPGGPTISAAAAQFKISNLKFKIDLPRPMIDSDDFDFSFSGLKTAVIREIQRLKTRKQFNNLTIEQLSFETQEAITDVLAEKTIRAAKKYQVKTILLAGGVAANDLLRQKFKVKSSKLKVNFFAPAKNLCTDNAAIVAAYAYFNFKPLPWQKLQALPSLGL